MTGIGFPLDSMSAVSDTARGGYPRAMTTDCSWRPKKHSVSSERLAPGHVSRCHQLTRKSDDDSRMSSVDGSVSDSRATAGNSPTSGSAMQCLISGRRPISRRNSRSQVQSYPRSAARVCNSPACLRASCLQISASLPFLVVVQCKSRMTFVSVSTSFVALSLVTSYSVLLQ